MTTAPFLDRWEEMLRIHGNFPAIEEPDGRIVTSRGLDLQASALANRWIAGGLGPGDIVASRLGRTIDGVAVLLATWKAGATWLPLDPAWPEARMTSIVSAARPALVLESTESFVLRPDRVPGPLSAYVIATSGSTGAPKLVEVAHVGLVPMLLAQVDAFGISPGSRVLSALSTGFDATLSDWGTALLSGATLVLAPPRLLESPSRTLAFLRDRTITHADLPPALLPSIQPESLPSTLETVIVGGEVSAPAVLRRWASRCSVVSVYGPTEATICCALAVVDPVRWDRPLVGEPIAGTRLRIEPDARMDGTGELWIGGDLLATGYRNDRETTARSFVFQGDSRWFRTGDRVRLLAGDALEFVGRMDQPLKLSGHRVELAELELAIAGLPGVRGAIVRPLQLPSGRWIAWAVVESDESIAVLRDRARLELPTGWVPARWSVVERLPRGPGGKLDRARLEQFEPSDSQAIRGLEGPLADAWEAVLGVRQVAGTDRFDLLGGDSLACLELALRLEALGHRIDPADLAARPRYDIQMRLLTHHDDSTTHHDAHTTQTVVDAKPTPSPTVHARSDRRGVLVTGAAGFIGRALVARLLELTDRPVFGLFRATGRSGSMNHPRFTRLHGDVRTRSLGLDPSQLGDVGLVVHLAADLSLVGTDEQLAATNVTGAANAAALASELGAHLHHVSTLSVFTHTREIARVIDETTRPPPPSELDSAYARTKREAEALVQSWRGLASTCWRPGLVLADDERGGADHFSRVVRGLKTLGCAPEDFDDERFDVTPREDLVEALLAGLSLDAPPPVVHVVGDRTFRFAELLDAMRDEGVSIRKVPRDVWQSTAAGWDADVLFARASLATDPKGFRLFEATRTLFDNGLFRRLVPRSSRSPVTLGMYVRAALGQP